MTEDNKDGKDTTGQNTGEVTTSTTDEKKLKIGVTVSNEQLEEMMKRLKKEEEEREALQKKFDEVTAGKEKAEKDLVTKTAEAEDLEGKMKIIAQQKFDEKKTVLMDNFKKVIKDEDRLKQITDSIKEPDDLKATQFMYDTLVEQLEKGHQQAKDSKDAEAAAKLKAERDADPVGKGAAGQIPLQNQGGEVHGKQGKKYESSEAMIQDVRRKSHSSDPEEVAEAEVILDEWFRKWGAAVKTKYDGQGKSISVTKEDQSSLRKITKEGGAA